MNPVEARIRAASELRELTVAMRRQVLSRQHPAETPEEIEQRLREWILEAGPPFGRVGPEPGTSR